MSGAYDLWLVVLSYFVAFLAAYVALELAGRVVVASNRSIWMWLVGGSVAFGLGIWSMHFVGMLAFHLPIPLTYDLSITLLSLVPAVMSAALLLVLVRWGKGFRHALGLGAIVLGAGIAGMHYTGMAAIPVVPAIRYDPVMLAVSVAIAIVVAFVALKLAFSLSVGGSRVKKLAAAAIMGSAVSAMHYTGMAAARFAPESVCVVSADSLHQVWLGAMVAFNTLSVLLITVAIIFYDVKRAEHRGHMVEELQSTNAALAERTQRAERAELAMQEGEARFRDLTELSSDWFWEQDEQFRFTHMSGGILEWLGLNPESFIGRARWDFPIVASDETVAAHKALLDAHKPFRDFVYCRQNPGGKQVYISTSGMPLFDASGRFTGYRGVGRDITGQKQVEQTLREAHEKIAASVSVLESRNREIAILSELSNLLLSCTSVEEACRAVPKFCENLFPCTRGTLFLMHNSRDQLVPSAAWGNALEEVAAFVPDDCWALRRGRVHAVSDPTRDPVCKHAAPASGGPGGPYLCLPLIIQGDRMGLLWIAFAVGTQLTSGQGTQEHGKQQLANALSDQIGLALSNIRLREDLRQQSIRDPLTGLYNRRFLEESLAREMARCKRKGAVFAVLMLDVDHFKRFNDTFGHEAGDVVLRSTAQAMQKNFREGDIVCRFGGEEFVVVLPDTNPEGAAVSARHMLEIVRSQHVSHNGKTLGAITISIGMAMYPCDGESVRALIESADKALYEAKGAGRDRLVIAQGSAAALHA